VAVLPNAFESIGNAVLSLTEAAEKVSATVKTAALKQFLLNML